MSFARRIQNPYTGGTPYKIQTHCHTNGGVNDDGDFTPQQVFDGYASAGFDLLAITGHNQIYNVQAEALSSGVAWIPSQEQRDNTDTLYDDPNGPVSGTALERHIVSLNITDTAETVTPITNEDSLQTIIQQTRTVGGVPIVAHPHAQGNGAVFGINKSDITKLAGVSHIEIYNSTPYGAYGPAQGYSEVIWDELLSAGDLYYGVACDDYHRNDYTPDGLIGSAYCVVFAASLDKDVISEAFRKGNFYFATGAVISSIVVSGLDITITTDSPSKFEWVTKGGIVSQTTLAAIADTYTIQAADKYARLRITRDSDSKVAWSQPFLNVGK